MSFPPPDHLTPTSPGNPTDGSPAFAKTRFTCPSCDQLAEQVWLNVYAEPVNNPAGVPLRIAGTDLDRLRQNPHFTLAVREQKVHYWNRVNQGDVFLDRWAPVQTELFVAGLDLSVCRLCRATAVWLGGQLVDRKK